MKTANNPFLATVQNKTSTTSNADNGDNHSNISSSHSSTTTNDKGNKKLRRQTISDPHAYIRYIHSLLGDKCISKSCTSTLAKSTTATATATTRPRPANDDKSQKQCQQQQQQQQQQLQQIGLQFQGIPLYDDDVAKSQNNSSNNGTRNNKCKIANRNNDNDKRKSLENQQNALYIVLQQQQQQQQQQQKKPKLLLSDEEAEQRQTLMGIEGKLIEQIRLYNANTNNSNNKWMGTYPTTRVKKTPISLLTIPNTLSVTYTTTTNVTRMTPKIAPTSITTAEAEAAAAASRPIKSALRKHHSFNMQPTYIMHKQLHLHRQQQPQIQQIACVAKQTTDKLDVNEIEQQLMTSRYHATFGGPLVFRPLTLNEKHNFKPIARPDGMDGMSSVFETKLHEKQQNQQQANENKYHSRLYEEEYEAEEEELNKPIQNEEFVKDIEEVSIRLSSGSSSSSATITPTQTNSPTLHPAASLEVLEALTQSNPELIYAAIQPGSRLNLHTQLSALNNTHYNLNMSPGQTELRTKLHATLSDSTNIEHNAQKYQTALRRSNAYVGDNDILLNTSINEAADEAKMPEDDFCFYEIPINNSHHTAKNDINRLNDNENNTDDNHVKQNQNDVSSNSTVTLNSNNDDDHIKYLCKENLHEIHI